MTKLDPQPRDSSSGASVLVAPGAGLLAKLGSDSLLAAPVSRRPAVMRRLVRVLLLLGLATAMVRKLAWPAPGPVLGGAVGTWVAMAVEVAALWALVRGADVIAGVLVCVLCAAGIALAWWQPGLQCGCFGAGVARAQHFMFAGTLGSLAGALVCLALPAANQDRAPEPPAC